MAPPVVAADTGASILGSANTAPRPRKVGKPAAGESSRPQNTLTGMPFAMGGLLASAYGMAGGGAFGPGGGWSTLFPGGFPGISLAFGGALFGFGASGFVQPRKGSYATYRLMSIHPTLRLVKQLIVGPILSSQWTVKPADWAADQQAKPKKGKKAPPQGSRPKLDPVVLENAVQMVKEQVLPLRGGYLNEALRYLEFGWRPFEKVWDVRRGGMGGKPLYWLRKLKPLLPDLTQILHDGRGNYSGLTQLAAQDGLRSDKTFIVSYDVEAGNLYGYSRHEAAYDPWVDWQSARIRRWLTGNKLAGYMPVLYYRPGTTPVNGVDTDNYQIGKRILAAASMGNGSLIPTTEYTDEELQASPELAGLAPWKLDIVDCGNYAPAVTGMIEESQYDDRLLVRAWGWPERAVLEAQRSGSRADSKTHSDNSELDRELIDDDLAAQLTAGQSQYEVPGVVGDILEINVGTDYRDAVAVAPAPLVDRKVEVYTTILSAMLEDQAVAPLILSKINDDALLDHLDIDKSDDQEARLSKLLEVAQQAKGGPPQDLVDSAGEARDAAKKGKAPKTKGKSKRPEAAKVLSRWLSNL